MDKTELQKLEKKIREEIKKTEGKITEYSKLCKPIPPENSIGRISRMDAINNKSVVEAALRTAKDKHTQLNNIQNEISNPDFGVCKKCKKRIPFQRLIIQPQSKFCVLCAK